MPLKGLKGGERREGGGRPQKRVRRCSFFSVRSGTKRYACKRLFGSNTSWKGFIMLLRSFSSSSSFARCF